MSERPYVDPVEQALRDLGGALDVPPPPAGLAASVATRLRAEAGGPAARRRGAVVAGPWARRPVRSSFAGHRTGRLAAAAVLVVALVAGALAWDRLGTGDDGLRVATPAPSGPSAPLGSALALGQPATMAEAAVVLGEDLLLPSASGLGAPDEILIRRTVSPPLVFFVWAAGDGLPEVGDTGIGLLLTELAGRTGCAFDKILQGSTGAVPTFANGWRAIWADGRHVLRYCTGDGRHREQPARLPANALIWSEGQFTYRLEAEIDQATAEAIADSMS